MPATTSSVLRAVYDYDTHYVYFIYTLVYVIIPPVDLPFMYFSANFLPVERILKRPVEGIFKST